MNLGELIKNYREEHGMSQGDFSKISGISVSYLSVLERNKRPSTNTPVEPSFSIIKKCADAMGVDYEILMQRLDGKDVTQNKGKLSRGITINVLGRVAAGIPIEAIEYIIDTEEISLEMAKSGEYFGLKIKGDSMEPKISNGDVVIVRRQNDAESGEIVIAAINGSEATCKKLQKYDNGIALISMNPAYPPMYFDRKEIESKPITIIGRVVELRAKF